MMLRRPTLPALAALFALSGAPETLAQAAAAPPLAQAEPSTQTAVSASTDAELETLSGGQNTFTALTEQDLTAVNSGNQINAGVVESGSISFRDNALSGFNGIGNFVMNTGNNNNLQGSISVTIVIGQ
jgi:hypothetical protein